MFTYQQSLSTLKQVATDQRYTVLVAQMHAAAAAAQLNLSMAAESGRLTGCKSPQEFPPALCKHNQ